MVSVVLPVLNEAGRIARCIRSVLRQTYGEWELLVFDDGSTDGTLDILDRFLNDDARIHLFRRDHSYIRNLNEGFDLSRGRYVAHMDADDIMLPQRLEKQVMEMERNPYMDLLGSTAYVSGRDERTGDKFHSLWMPPQVGRRLEADDMLFVNHIIHPSVMFRMSSVREYGLRYKEEYLYAEDLELWTQYLEKGLHMEVMREPLVVYTKHAGSMSMMRQDRIRERRIAINRRLVRLIETGCNK